MMHELYKTYEQKKCSFVDMSYFNYKTLVVILPFDPQNDQINNPWPNCSV